MAKMRIDTLKSAVEAAGVTMAPASDQFDADPAELTEHHAAGYMRAFTTQSSLDTTSAKVKNWLALHWPRALSTG